MYLKASINMRVCGIRDAERNVGAGAHILIFVGIEPDGCHLWRAVCHAGGKVNKGLLFIGKQVL